MKQVALIVVLCCALTPALIAQTDTVVRPQGEVLVMGGVSYPYLPSETRDYWKPGWNASVGYGYSFSPGALGYATAYASVDFSRSAFYESRYRSTFSLPGSAGIALRGSMRVVTVMANFKGSFSSSRHTIAPYFLLGVGFMHYASDSLAAYYSSAASVKSESLSGVAWSAGIGVEVPVTESLVAFVQGKSVLGVFDQQRQFFPLSGGVLWRL